MGYDEVCVLCGVRPRGGPVWLCGNNEKLSAEQIAQEILQAKPDLSMSIEELVSTLQAVIDATEGLESLPAYSHRFSAVASGYDGDAVAIGHFDEHGLYMPCNHHGRTLHPTGDGVQMRIVRGSCGGGLFVQHIEVRGTVHVVTSYGETNCDTHWGPNAIYQPSCNIWVHFGCWHMLRNWLDCSLPPRLGRDGKPLILFGELYEVVASRHERQEHGGGWLPCIDYGGTLDAYMGSQYQDYILGPRKGVAHTVQAIEQGLRDESLIPAILEDSRYWMFVRPDDWPRAPRTAPCEPSNSALAQNTMSQPQAAVCCLPNELWPGLLQHARLEDVFSLAATCKDLYTRVLDRGTLHHLVCHAIDNIASPLHWIVPVRTGLREEWLAACDAMKTWLPKGPPPPLPFVQMKFDRLYDINGGEYEPRSSESESTGRDHDYENGGRDRAAELDASDEGITTGIIVDVPLPSELADDPLPPLPLFDSDFPLLNFLRAYRRSDSMRARQRRWEIIKQFDVLFANYRRDGWERGDDFLSGDAPWVLDDNGFLRCPCRMMNLS